MPQLSRANTRNPHAHLCTHPDPRSPNRGSAMLHGLIQLAELSVKRSNLKLMPARGEFPHRVWEMRGGRIWKPIALFANSDDALEFIAAKLPLVMGDWS